MIRLHKGDILRYGDYSRIGESIYNHPFQWGSKRTGPDLAREGGVRSDGWHYEHMINPRMNPGSIMPSYHWMADQKTDFKSLPKKIQVLRKLGVPYEAMNQHEIEQNAREQALEIAKGLVAAEVDLPADMHDMEDEDAIAAALSEREIVAMIAYLQKLGAYDEVQQGEREKIPSIIDPDKKHTSASN